MRNINKALAIIFAVSMGFSTKTYGASQSYTIWPGTVVPTVTDGGPDSSVEVGVRFKSDSNGSITALRFYKAKTNTGTHVGNLWTNSGTRLATATFANETASGWQQVSFASPVTITANIVYVASYHTNNGHYSDDSSYFTAKGVDSAPLHALQDSISGVNGSFIYSSSSKFPTQSWKSSNYWVDVVFTPSQADTTPPTITLFTVPATSNTLTVPITNFTATDNIGVTGYLVNESATAPLPTATGWSGTPPASYTFSAPGGKTLYAWAEDAAGNISVSKSAPVTVDTTSPIITGFSIPATSNTLTVPITNFTATDNFGVVGYLVTESATTPLPTASGWSGTPPNSYIFASSGSKTLYAWAKDASGNVSTAKSGTVLVSLSGNRPILLITSSLNPFTGYYAEILRAEGLNYFATSDIASVTSSNLASYDLIILGEMQLSTSQVSMFTNWVNGGGKLFAMRPDKQLSGLLGLTDNSSTLSNGYLLTDTSSAPGKGIVNQTIQFHGTADLYSLNGAKSMATLYTDSTTASSSPAATSISVGTNGGEAVAFTFDLARSVIYTRQGNPAWSGQARDGVSPIRSDDLYFGNASFDSEQDWIDLNKVAIPQADEQQRLFANIIIEMTFGKKPLPRFWYLPRSLPAVVVMTGDDHAYGGTAGRFDSYIAASPADCTVANWECIRSTSYIYPDTPLTNNQASAYNAAGFEIGLHVTTNCADWTPSTLASFYSTQLSTWSAKYTSLPSPVTNRTHCIAWSDFATQPAIELSKGIRLDANYYYWPPSWINDRPGFFTGSGIPMRFADASGNIIDVYQAATQMTDESGQSYPATIDTLLDNAIGSQGYYGVFVVNAHTDNAASTVSDAVINSAIARGIPVISSRQLLAWLDGRNGSSFSSFSWDGSTLVFSISAAQGANGLVALSPIPAGMTVTSITCNGKAIPFNLSIVKGIQYASFTALNGAYQVTYAVTTSAPSVSGVSPLKGATSVSPTTDVSAVFSTAMDPATINPSTFVLLDAGNTAVPATITYVASSNTATMKPSVALSNSTTYTATIKGGAAGAKNLAGIPLSADFVWTFSTAASQAGPITIWPSTAVPGLADSGPDSSVELGVRFQSDLSGYITGVRFFKASANTGTHVGTLWDSSGTQLATATFTGESSSGWQQVSFPSPVAISANTVYIASYHTNAGHYSADQNYFAAKGVDNPPLHALLDGQAGFDGVYGYGSKSVFPNNGWRSTNYWVDVIFSTSAPLLQPLQSQDALQPQVPTLTKIEVTPSNQRISMGSVLQFTAMGTLSDGSIKNVTDQVLWTSSDTALVTVNSTGLASAVGLGQATIAASQGAISGKTSVTSTAAAAMVNIPTSSGRKY